MRRNQYDEAAQDSEDEQRCRLMGDLQTAVAMEDLFAVLREAHIGTGHGKTLAMYKKLQARHFNISREMCEVFKNECATCKITQSQGKKVRAGHKPIVTAGFGTRGQVDLIDMQSSEYDGMKWLLTYVDHGTKLGCSEPLPNKEV